MRRCKKCIIPDTYKDIVLNEEGICNLCRQRDFTLRNITQLKHLFHLYKKGTFDCLIPISGGKDSIFMLYYAVKKLGLTPLALYYKSGFETQIAQKNVREACKNLNVRLVVKKANVKIQRNLLKYVLRISEVRGLFFNTCLNCEVILRGISINVARKYNIPVVLWGSSFVDTRDIEEYEKYMTRKSNFIKRVIKRESYFLKTLNFSKFFKILIPLIKYLFLSFLQKKKMGIPFWIALNPRGHIPFPKENPTFVPFFDYVPPMNLKEDIQILKRETNWKSPPHKKVKFDCKLYCFINYTCLQLYGISDEGCIYSNYIRKGLMSREEAFLKEIDIQKNVLKECKRVIKEMGFKRYRFPPLKFIPSFDKK